MALRKMSVDIDFGIDLSEIKKLDSSIDDTVNSVTGGMAKAEKSVDGLGDEFGNLSKDASSDMAKVGASIKDIGSDVSTGESSVDRLKGSFSGLASGVASDMAKVGASVRGITSDSSNGISSVDGLKGAFSSLASGVASDMAKVGASVRSISGDTSASESSVNKLKSSFSKVGTEASKDVDKVNKSLKNLNVSEADKAAKSVKKIGDEAKDTEKKLDELSKKLGTGIKAGLAGAGVAAAGAIAGFFALGGEETQSFIEDMGKLETAFTTSGHSAKAGKDTYQELVGLLGETDQSVEAANHLAKLTDSEEDLSKWTDICAGVYATFGDSLPIEGLTEAANETAKVGQIVGPLADAINWATTDSEAWSQALSGNEGALKAFEKATAEGMSSEDAFNEALKACNSEQERAQLITNTLNGLYDESSDKYKEINKDLIESRQAQSNFSAAMAEVGKIAMPIMTTLKNAVADFVTENKPMLEEFGKKIGEILEDVGGKIKNVITFVSENINTILPILATVVGTIIALKVAISAYNLVMGTYKVIMGIATAVQWAYNTALFGCPVIWIIAAIMAIIAVIILMIIYWDEIVAAISAAWDWTVSILSQVGQWIYDNVIQPVVQFFAELWSSIISGLQAAWSWVVNLLVTVATWIWNNVLSPIINFYVNFWTTIINGVVNSWNWIVGILGTVAGWINSNVVQPVVNFFTGLWSKITEIFGNVSGWFKEKFLAAYKGIVNIFSKIGGFFSGIWETIKSIFTNIGQSIADGVSGAFKSTVNAVLGFADSIINGFIRNVNSAIDIINEIPLVDIPKIPELNIPRLATGGIVEGSTVANVGEAGAEAIVPLEKNLGWLNKMGGMIANAILSQAQYQPSSNMQSSGGQSITVQEGAIQITINDTGNSSETANKVKNTIESFFAQIRRGGSYAVTEV